VLHFDFGICSKKAMTGQRFQVSVNCVSEFPLVEMCCRAKRFADAPGSFVHQRARSDFARDEPECRDDALTVDLIWRNTRNQSI
jgi:hypothetical protein